MNKNARPSWLPIAAAIGLPVLLLGSAFLISKSYIPKPAANSDELLTTRHGQIYVSVKIENPDGQPVEGKLVTFTQTRTAGDSAPLEVLTRTSDAGGFVTVTITKIGDISVAADDVEKKETLKDVGNSTRDSYDIRMVTKPSQDK